MEKCFADRGRSCAAIKGGNCRGCSFYKTQEQYIQDQEQSLKRIRSLPEEVQAAIADHYYSGELPAAEAKDEGDA